MEYLAGILVISWPVSAIFIVRHHLNLAKKIAPDPQYHKYLLFNLLYSSTFPAAEIPMPHDEKYSLELIKNRKLMFGRIFLYFVATAVITIFLQKNNITTGGNING